MFLRYIRCLFRQSPLWGTLLFICAASSSNPEDSIISTLDVDDIVGPVKSVRLEESWFVDRDGERTPEDRIVTAICTYDPSGIMVERNEWGAKDKPTGRSVRELNGDGRIVKEAKYTGENALITRTEYRYDEGGVRTESLSYRFNGKLYERLLHRYDGKGRPIENRSMDGDESIKKTVFAYDERGSVSSHAIYDATGKMTVKEDYYYDDGGNLVQSVLLNGENQVMATMTYLRDDEGRKTEVMAHSKYKNPDMRWLYKYNDRGDVSEKVTFGKMGYFMNRELYEYEYDGRGNWISRKESLARLDSNYEIPNRIVYRNIEYFDEGTE